MIHVSLPLLFVRYLFNIAKVCLLFLSHKTKFTTRPPWSRNVKTIVIGKVDRGLQRGLWVFGRRDLNKELLKDVRTEMIEEQDLNIQLEDYVKKVDEWEERYHQFTWLLKQRNVDYNQRNNHVTAGRHVWNRIASVNKLSLI